MEALCLTENNEWRPFGEKGDHETSFLFLLFDFPEKKLLLLAPLLLLSHEMLSHDYIYKVAIKNNLVPKDQTPSGAGFISMREKIAKSWQSASMGINTPWEHCQEIREFMNLKKL